MDNKIQMLCGSTRERMLHTVQQQYLPDRCRTALYRSDLGLEGDPFYKGEVMGWYIYGVKRVRLGKNISYD